MTCTAKVSKSPHGTRLHQFSRARKTRPRDPIGMATAVAIISLLGLGTAGALVHQNTLEAGGWFRHPSEVDAGERISFVVALKQSNLEALFRTALAVSTPGHPRYGRHLTPARIREITAPAAADVAAVSSWLSAAGIAWERQHDSLHVQTTVGAASRLLSTEFGVYHRPVDGRTIVRASDYELPAQVAAAVAAIFNLHGTALSGSISTVLTGLSWICVGIHSRRALPCPVCA